MKPLLWINDIIFLLFLLFWAQCEGSVPTVTAAIHETAVLPCSVPFISGTQDLMVSWVKKIGKKPSLVLHTFIEGQFNLTYQAPQYRGRTNMSTDLSNGRLDLTLTHVKHRDEGVYVCQATNTVDYRDIDVRLTVIAPVSDPVLSVSCRPDGSAEISCRAQNGSDPAYSLSVNGRIELEDSGSPVSGSGVNITVSSAPPWNISCSVRNRISERNSSLVSESCAEKKHRNEHDIVIGQNFLGPESSQRKGYIEERSAGSGRVCPGPGLVLTIALLVFFVVNEHFGIAVTSAIIVCNV